MTDSRCTGLPVVGMVGAGQLARMTHQAAIQERGTPIYHTTYSQIPKFPTLEPNPLYLPYHTIPYLTITSHPASLQTFSIQTLNLQTCLQQNPIPPINPNKPSPRPSVHSLLPYFLSQIHQGQGMRYIYMLKS